MIQVEQGMQELKERAWGAEVLLTCDPTDADVFLDGVPQGTCLDFSGSPRGLTLPEGMHKIEVKKAGFWPYETYVDSGGTRTALTARLTPH